MLPCTSGAAYRPLASWPQTETPARENARIGILTGRCPWSEAVVRDRIELSTFRFSGGRSYQLSYLTIGGLTVPPLFPSGPDGI